MKRGNQRGSGLIQVIDSPRYKPLCSILPCEDKGHHGPVLEPTRTLGLLSLLLLSTRGTALKSFVNSIGGVQERVYDTNSAPGKPANANGGGNKSSPAESCKMIKHHCGSCSSRQDLVVSG